MTCVFEWMNVYFSLFRAIGSLDWSTLLVHLSLFFCRSFSLYFCQSSCVSCLLHHGSRHAFSRSDDDSLTMTDDDGGGTGPLSEESDHIHFIIITFISFLPILLLAVLILLFQSIRPSFYYFSSDPIHSLHIHYLPFPLFCTLASYNVIIAF